MIKIILCSYVKVIFVFLIWPEITRLLCSCYLRMYFKLLFNVKENYLKMFFKSVDICLSTLFIVISCSICI